MEILNTLATEDIFELGYGTYYVADANIRFDIKANNFKMTDLTNAQVKGAECVTVNYSFYLHDKFSFYRFLLANYGGSIYNMYNAYMAKFTAGEGTDFDSETNEYNGVYIRTEKGTKTFSPFALAKIKPLTSAPKKWSVNAVIRAMVNNQVENFKCDGVYTDDYAYDAMVNYCKGGLETPEIFKLAKTIVEDSRGWVVYTVGNTVVLDKRMRKSFSFTFVTGK